MHPPLSLSALDEAQPLQGLHLAQHVACRPLVLLGLLVAYDALVPAAAMLLLKQMLLPAHPLLQVLGG